MVTTQDKADSTRVEEVKLLSFSQLQQAYLIKGKLEDNGIFCYLTNENTSQVAPHYSVMGVWMDLMIRKEDLDNALQILCDGDEKKLLELQGWRFCPNCGSNHLRNKISKGKIAQAGFMLLFNLGFKSNDTYECSNCGTTFKA